MGNISEASGSSNNVWQRVSNVPVFTWAASTDSTSGVARYQLRLVDSEGRVVLGDCLIDSLAARECRPTASGLRTGTYMLRTRAGPGRKLEHGQQHLGRLAAALHVRRQ
jgi:hypothetical protein